MSDDRHPATSPALATDDGRPTTARLYVGPTFLTGPDAREESRAVLVDARGRIVQTFARIPVLPEVETVRLPGALALPGLHDAHLHLEGIGMKAAGVALENVRSRAELRERVRAYVAAHPNATLIRGFGWDQELFADGKFPDGSDIAGLTEKPIFLMRVDGHAAIVNEALARGFVTGAPNSNAGGVFRDALGRPTGLIMDQAVIDTEPNLPKPTWAERKQELREALWAAQRAGLTAVHEMSMWAVNMDALLELQREGPLPVRVFVYMPGTEAPWILSNMLTHRREGRVKLQGIKLMLDGALGSRGALLYEPYADDAPNRGHPAYSFTLQRSVFRLAQQMRWQVAVHAIGDEANDTALSWIEQHQNPANLPTRVEHAQVVRPGGFARFAEAGAIASIQPMHATDDGGWAEARLGPMRVKGAYATRSHLRASTRLAFGSDAPVSDLRPARGIYAALTRETPEGKPPGGWQPEQRLTFDEALAGYTRGAAGAVGEARHLGTLEPGKAFDVSLFEADCRKDPKCWLTVQPLATVVGGEVLPLSR